MFNPFIRTNKLESLDINTLNNYVDRYNRLSKDWGRGFWISSIAAFVSIFFVRISAVAVFLMLLTCIVCTLVENHYDKQVKRIKLVIDQRYNNL